MIHPSAIVSESAKVSNDAEIGPFCLIGENVEVGSGTRLHSHVVVKRDTKIGKNNEFFQFCSVGEDCQDKKYAGEQTFLEIGDDNVFRESCTFHRGTVQDNSITKIGNRNLFMVNTHIAHDCIVGSDCIMANNTTLGGHVHIGDFVILGGHTAIHQFCHVGSHAMTGGGAILVRDVAPYVMYSGTKHTPQGINSEGLRRRGFDAEQIQNIKRAYKVIYRNNNTIEEARSILANMANEFDEVEVLFEFLNKNNRGLAR